MVSADKLCDSHHVHRILQLNQILDSLEMRLKMVIQFGT